MWRAILPKHAGEVVGGGEDTDIKINDNAPRIPYALTREITPSDHHGTASKLESRLVLETLEDRYAGSK
jgi:hypothetical protein